VSAASPPDAEAACDMAPLVEARRDGRVGDRESSSLDRHLLACGACRALAADLERMASLAGGSRLAKLSPLEQRRGRLRLLQDAAFAPGPASGPRARSRVKMVRFAAAAALLLGVLAGGTALAVLGLPSAKADPETPESIPGSSAASSAIGRAAASAPIATSVEAPLPAVLAAPATTVAAASAPVVVAPRLTGSRPKKVDAAPAASSVEASALADGVDLIERGDYGAAAERLRAFRQSHPTDVRAEDAAFLAVLALERAGRHAAAVASAREYLASYPQGYRRAEAQAIASAP
jgi:hypothetical protein